MIGNDDDDDKVPTTTEEESSSSSNKSTTDAESDDVQVRVQECLLLGKDEDKDKKNTNSVLKEDSTTTVRLPTDIAVKLYVTGVEQSYLNPWTVKGQRKWTGTGFILSGQRIMTNAHVAANATVVQVQKQENPKKYRGKVQCLAHDLDLAIVTVEEDEFWENITSHGSFRTATPPHPELNSEVKACGFPSGGSTVCVTKGVLSRIDAHLYSHPQSLSVLDNSRNSPGDLLIYQIDAAINPGSSGGPTFDSEGFIMGVASSGNPGAQNIGYIIPATIATLFLDEYSTTGTWSGQSEVGLHATWLENDTMREYLKMADTVTGVLVLSLAPMGALYGKVQCGDVITQVDGNKVSNEGKVPLSISGKKVYISTVALITQKPKGETTKISILRKGQSHELDVVFSPIPPLSPRYHNVDVTPEYIIFAGFVFTIASIPLRREYFKSKQDKYYKGPYVGNCINYNPSMEWKQHETQQIVIMLRILEHDVNLGYYDQSGVVQNVNDRTIDNIDQLAETFAKALSSKSNDQNDDFVRIKISSDKPEESNTLSTFVLKKDNIQAANQDICQQYRIPAIASERLMKKYFSL